MFHHNHNAQRTCSRCGKELTDAASQECGVGPVCRKMDNALFAATIPSNLTVAVQSYKNINVGHLPVEAIPTFIRMEADLLAEDAETRLDWRETVKRVEWLRSFNCLPTEAIYSLYGIADGLGYVGLVSMWKGGASSGKATIWYQKGRLYAKGPMNKAFRIAFKHMTGWMFHSKNGYAVDHAESSLTVEQKPCWSVPASQAASFSLVIKKHYPNHEGLKDALAESVIAKELVKPIEVVTTPEGTEYYIGENEQEPSVTYDPDTNKLTISPEPMHIEMPAANNFGPSAMPTEPLSCEINDLPIPDKKLGYAAPAEDGWIKLVTPYNQGFINDIKGIPYYSRKWQYTPEKCWKVAPEYKAKALQILKTYFPKASEVEL